MRRLLIAVPALLLAISCGRRLPNQPAVPGGTGSYQRTILLEMFTATWCTNCPAADTTIERVSRELGDSAVLVEYHPTSGGDPFGFLETANRGNFYGVFAWPTLRVDGIDSLVGTASGLYQTYRAKAANRLLVKSPLKVSITGQAGAGQFDYQVSVQADTSLRQTDLRLLALVLEDSIAYAAPNGTTLQRLVVRQILPSAQGTALSISPGGSATKNGTFTFAPSWRQDRLYLAALVQDWNTKEVLQSDRIDISIPGYQFELTATDTFASVPVASIAAFPFIIKNTGLMPDTVVLDMPDSLASSPPPDRSVCDRYVCYPLPFKAYIAPGDSITGLTVHMLALSAGSYRGGLSMRSVSNSSLIHVINFHIEVTP